MRYLILGLPRSRTAWLANAMTHGESFCWHDEYHDIDGKIVGMANTGEILNIERVEIPTVCVHRPVREVRESCGRLKIGGPFEYAARKLRDLRGPVLHVGWDELGKRGAEIWRHCVGEGFDERRWAMLDNFNVQVIL